jgi:crotonobetainyl-CoA:carnitine CoA-transferase CaiB-like acyl-CoA transferase
MLLGHLGAHVIKVERPGLRAMHSACRASL